MNYFSDVAATAVCFPSKCERMGYTCDERTSNLSPAKKIIDRPCTLHRRGTKLVNQRKKKYAMLA